MTDILTPRAATAAALSLAAALLAGCAVSDDRISNFMVVPGNYKIYSCPEISEQIRANLLRQRELERLIERAGTDGAGKLVTATTYQPELLNLRGLMKDLRQEAIEKSCEIPSDAVLLTPAKPVERASPAARPQSPRRNF